MHHSEFSKEDEIDAINKEYEYNNYESFDPLNNAYKKVEPDLQNPEKYERADNQQSSAREYDLGQKLNRKMPHNPISGKEKCNQKDETLHLIRKLNGVNVVNNCEDKETSAIDLIRAINGRAGALNSQYQTDNGIGILSKIFNFARNLPIVN